jgi:hypothetical protein
MSGALTVWPITRGNGHGGDYMLLSRAVEKGIARVTEIDDGAEVPVIQIENMGNIPLLGIQGEEYVGSKQNRTLNISVLAAPGKTRIPVTCVEQGRWDTGVMHFSAGLYEHKALRLMKAEMTSKTRKSSGDAAARYAADQGKVWGEVKRASNQHNVNSPTGAMHALYDSKKISGRIDDIVKRIELPGDTRGAVVATGGRIEAADLFESNDVFKLVWSRLLKSYALGALRAKKGVPPSTEAAESFVHAPASLTWSATPSVGLGEDVRWENENQLATALIWEDRFLHASLFAR